MANLSIMYRVGMEVSELNKGVQQVNSKLDSITGLAGEVGAGLMSAFTATALVAGVQQLVSSTLEYADALSNLNAKTGVSLQGLQQLEAIGQTAGVSMETLASAVNLLQKNLSTDKGVDAIAEMELNFQKIRAMEPEEQFMTIARRLAEMDDPIEKAKVGTALFGKKWADVAAAFSQDVDEIIGNTHTMSDAQVESTDAAGDAWDRWTRNVGSQAKSLVGSIFLAIEWVNKLRGSFELLGNTPIRIPKLPEPPKPNIGASPTKPLEDFAAIAKIAKEQDDALTKSIREREKAEAKAAAETEKHAQKVAAGLEKMRLGNLLLGQAAVKAARDTSPLLMGTGELVAVSNDYSKTLMQSQIHLDAFGHVIATNVMPSIGNLGQGVIDVTGATVKFSDVLKTFPTLLVNAFTGGGGVKGALNALGALMGQQMFSEDGIFKNAEKNVATSLGKVLPKGLADAFGAAIPAVGALIGPAFGKLASWIGSLFGNKTKDAIVDSFGSYDALRQKLNALGDEGERMWIRLTQQTGRNDLASTKAQIEEINKALNLQATALQSVDEVAKKYGFTIEELGPAWARQELDKKAQELYKDYMILTSAGVDHTVVLAKMANSVNDYVHNAIAMGVEVPEAMRPMLEAMVQQGLLTDAAGNKITDLSASGVTFAMTMSEGFKALIAEVQTLTEVIARSLGVSLDVVRRKANDAADAMNDGFRDAADAANDLADAVNGVSYGHSPGGLKDIIAMAPKAALMLVAMAENAGIKIEGLESRLRAIGRGIDIIIDPPPGLDRDVRIITPEGPGNLPPGGGGRPRSGGGGGGGRSGSDGLMAIERSIKAFHNDHKLWFGKGGSVPRVGGGNGGGGGVVTININGGAFDSPAARQDLATRVSRAVTEAQRRQQRGAA